MSRRPATSRPTPRAWIAGLAVAAVGMSACTAAGAYDEQARDRTAPLVRAAPPAPEPAQREAGRRPNVVLVTLDDMTHGDLAAMPQTRRIVREQGLTLTEGLAPTPICVPARASLLTGQYATNHGARTILGPRGGFAAFRDRNTLPVWLQRAGYATFFAGKYLNGYGEKDPTYVPPGWSSWHGAVDPTTYAFYGTDVNSNGTVHHRPEHQSDIVRADAGGFVERRARSKRPWFGWLNFVAPHHGGPQASPEAIYKTTVPAARHRGWFGGLRLPRDPAMLRGGEGAWGMPQLTPAERADLLRAHRLRRESLLSVDEAIGDLVRRLRATRQWRRTYLIITSDNGFLVGQHNRFGKLVAYDESVRVPMYVVGPGIPRGRRSATPATNPDLAVTIAAIAGARPGRVVDGVDLLPYWRSRQTYDRPVPLTAWAVEDGRRRLYTGVREGSLTFVRLPSGRRLLFDRTTDPGELRNRIRTRGYAAATRRMTRLERRYRDCAGATCPGEESFRPRD